MASGLFALLDDIAALMDDVIVMSKITTKKTAGILGDDLAVNAEKATGFVSSRELPVLWKITKGSFLNKIIILPFAFLLSYFVPWTIILILVLGGVYLAYEGAEKIVEYIFPHAPKNEIEAAHIELSPEAQKLAENKKVKSAIFTDFILSIEIVIIALGTVLGKSLQFQILVVSIVAIIATVGVYGIVMLIVRMDDLGFALIKKSKGKGILFVIGTFLVKALPWVIKSLSVIGTIALVLVAGGIFNHNIPFLHHFAENIPGFIKDFLIGLSVGGLVVLALHFIKKMIKKTAH